MPRGQINDPSSGKHYSVPFLPAAPSSPSQTLEGLFELTRRPSWALDSPRVLLPELQRYQDTVRWAALGTEVQGHHQQLLTQTLIVRCWKSTFLHRSLIVKSQQNRIELVTRPDNFQRTTGAGGGGGGSNGNGKNGLGRAAKELVPTLIGLETTGPYSKNFVQSKSSQYRYVLVQARE